MKYGPIYESGLNEHAEAAKARRSSENGVGYEEILIGVSEEDKAQFMGAHGTTLRMDGIDVPITVEEVTREESVGAFKKFVGEPTEKITDQNKVLSILAKSARSEALTDDERKALDPEDPTPGIGRSKSFEEGLDEFLSTGR